MDEFDATRTILAPPQTEGIKYAGSKLKLLAPILEMVASLNIQTVFDGFAGSTRVSQAFAQSGYQVHSNDISIWSHVFATCFLKNTKNPESYQELIDHLNSIPGKEGWFTEHYGGIANLDSSVQADGLKRPWQVHNTKKLDAIRDEIEKLNLDEVEKAVALTSLIFALDRVDSTLGHFVSYLRKWSQRSHKHLKLEVPRLFPNQKENVVTQGDVFDVSTLSPCDLAYFDPPYGSNNEKMPPSRVRYASYYHLWTTVCKNDQPDLTGKAKRRTDCSDITSSSVFEEFRKNPESGRFLAVEAIERLIQITPAKWILLSYNSGGRATADELRSVLNDSGEVVEVRSFNYRRNVMAKMRWTDDWINEKQESNREFLFLLRKNACD